MLAEKLAHGGHGKVPAQFPNMKEAGEKSWPQVRCFRRNYPMPQALTNDGIQEVVSAFAAATRRACQAGFRVIEIHAAHGYLIHEFLSPLSNKRSDDYGGSFENRTRFCREIVAAVRSEWPKELPLFLRISSTDWVDGGWNINESVKLAGELKQIGVDLIDCSSGAMCLTRKFQLVPVTKRTSPNGFVAKLES